MVKVPRPGTRNLVFHGDIGGELGQCSSLTAPSHIPGWGSPRPVPGETWMHECTEWRVRAEQCSEGVAWKLGTSD